MGFEVPNKALVSPTVDEELFKGSWDIFGAEVIRLQEEGLNFSLQGKATESVKRYQGANIYFYFVFVAQAARQKLELSGFLDTKCNAILIDEMYGLSCIEKNLPCLSTFFGTDYRKYWDQLLELFGIDRNTQACDDCCLGIGEMTMEDPDDCAAWIIGGCADIDITAPPTQDFGEFILGEFKIGEFTNFNET